jgi:glycosyltransferase involved in cell wall biosynthesis
MRILCVHNKFQKYAGSDAVALADEQLLAQHGDVTFYMRDSNEINSAGLLQRLGMGLDCLYSRRTVHEMTELVNRFRPDIAYVHNVFPLISLSLYDVLHTLGIPSVHIIHDFRLWCPNSRFYVHDHVCESCKLGNYWTSVPKRCVRGNPAYSALYASSLYLNKKMGLHNKIGGYICLTDFTKKLLLQAKIPGEKIYVCPNHIDTSTVKPQFGGGNCVVYLGGLYRDKGVFTVAKAFAKLPDIPLKMVGTGADEGELREFIVSNKLQNVELVGFKAGKEKMEVIRNSMFTLCPSHYYENFPLVVLEAFASGKPVVASATGALLSIIKPQETGLLFESGNPDDLAAKVRWMCEHPEQIESMGRNARNVVETEYDAGLRYASLAAIFQDVIEAAGRSNGNGNGHSNLR